MGKICIVMVLGVVLMMASTGYAQPSVGIQKGRFTWTWTRGTGGAVSSFRLKCGTATRTYTKVAVVWDPAARSAPVSLVVSTPGKYFCAVSAANAAGQSANSNEVIFFAVIKPAAPTNLQPSCP